MAEYLADDEEEDQSPTAGYLSQQVDSKVPEALRTASSEATKLVGESALSRQEKDQILAYREAPYLERAKTRAQDLDRSMQAQGMRFWAGRETEQQQVMKDTERELAQNVYVPMLEGENQLQLQRIQLAQQAGLAEVQANTALRSQGLAELTAEADRTGSMLGRQTLASREQSEASAIRARGQTLAETVGVGQLALAGRSQSLAETTQMGQLGIAQTEQAEASRIRALQQSLDEKVQLGQLTVQQAQQQLRTEIERGQLQLEQRRTSLAEQVEGGQLGLAQRQQALSETVEYAAMSIEQKRQALAEKEQAESSRVRDLEASLNQEIQRGSLTVEQAKQQLAAEIQRGSLALEKDRATVERDVARSQMSVAERQIDLEERIRTGELTLEQASIEQRQLEFDRSMEQRDNEFFATLGLSRDEFLEEKRRFDAGYTLETRELEEKIRQYNVEISQRQEEFRVETKIEQGRLALQGAEQTGEYVQLLTAADFGVDVSSYYNQKTGQITDLAQFYRVADTFAAKFQSVYGRAPTTAEANELIRGEQVPLKTKTLESGRLELQRVQMETDAAIERARLSGTVTDPDTGFSVATLEARKLALDKQLQEADRTGQFVQLATAEDFGIDVASYYNKDTGKVTDLAQFYRVADMFAANFKAVYGRDAMPLEAQALIRGEKVPVKMQTLAGKSMSLDEGRQVFEQAMEAADRTGSIVDPLTGKQQLTVQAQAQRDAVDLEKQGLTQEAARLQETSRQFNLELMQRVKEQAREHDLNEQQTAAQVANIYAGIEQSKKELTQRATEFFATNTRLMADMMGTSAGSGKMSLQALGLKAGSASEAMVKDAFQSAMGRAPTSGETYSLMMGTEITVTGSPTLAARQLAAQVSSDQMELAAQSSQIARAHDLDVRKFEAAMDQYDQDYALQSKELANRYGLDQQKFQLASQELQVRKAQINEDQAQGRISLTQAQAQLNQAALDSSRAYSLDSAKFKEASEQFDKQFGQMMTDSARAYQLNQQNFTEAKRQYDNNERRTNTVWDTLFRGQAGAKGWDSYSKDEQTQIMNLIAGSGVNFTGGGGGSGWEAIGRLGVQLIGTVL